MSPTNMQDRPVGRPPRPHRRQPRGARDHAQGRTIGGRGYRPVDRDRRTQRPGTDAQRRAGGLREDQPTDLVRYFELTALNLAAPLPLNIKTSLSYWGPEFAGGRHRQPGPEWSCAHMFPVVGIVVLILLVFGGFPLTGGTLGPVMHALPHEMLIIGGAALGSLLIGNSGADLKAPAGGLGQVFKGPTYKKQDYPDCILLVPTPVTT